MGRGSHFSVLQVNEEVPLTMLYSASAERSCSNSPFERELCDMEKRSTPRVVSAVTARTQLTQIMRRAKKGRERFVVDQRGEPQVVIMGIEDFLANVAPEPGVLAAIRAASKDSGTDKITMREIDQEIAAYRREKRL